MVKKIVIYFLVAMFLLVNILPAMSQGVTESSPSAYLNLEDSGIAYQIYLITNRGAMPFNSASLNWGANCYEDELIGLKIVYINVSDDLISIENITCNFPDEIKMIEANDNDYGKTLDTEQFSNVRFDFVAENIISNDIFGISFNFEINGISYITKPIQFFMQ